MSLIVTGAAGFIGAHVAQALLARGEQVIGIDNLNAYYDPKLKQARLSHLTTGDGFTFYKADISDRDAIAEIFATHSDADTVVHLAAQAGVRHSLTDPYAYVDANVMGHVVMLEASRKLPQLKQMVYASSSSVYGGNTKLPFAIEDRVDDPVSLYAATKRAGELIANAYGRLYAVPQTGLRFFTVYGPWGRPDMAAYIFADAISNGRPIKVFNNGDMRRDFTYIDDIVAGVLRAIDRVPSSADGDIPNRIYNLGNHRSERLMDFIETLEQAFGVEAVKDMQPMQLGDVQETFADIDASMRDLDFQPSTPISVGIPCFVEWYKSYHGAT